MKHALLILLAAAAGLAGCETDAGGGPPPPSASSQIIERPSGGDLFRDSDFAWSMQPGADSIDGVLAYKGGGGGKFSCAGSDVILAPVTPWSRQRMITLYNSATQGAAPAEDVRARTPPEHSDEYAHYTKRATCDANNHFGFSGLPDGAWYVITLATPVGGGPRVAIMRRVQTHGGVSKAVLN